MKPRIGRILPCGLFCSKMQEFGLVRFRREILCAGDSAIFVVSSVRISPPLNESYCVRPGSPEAVIVFLELKLRKVQCS